jgi:RNA polymerase sigma factor (sigma-70 family)
VAAGDQHAAKDATQEAYLVMYQRWPVRRSRSLDENRRYVIGIAVKKVADWFRATRDGQLHDDLEVGIDDRRFVEILDEQSVLAEVRALIDRQPARRRAVGSLFFLEGYEDCTEIGQILGISGSTVRTHVERLRKLLRPLVEQILGRDQGGDQL